MIALRSVLPMPLAAAMIESSSSAASAAPPKGPAPSAARANPPCTSPRREIDRRIMASLPSLWFICRAAALARNAQRGLHALHGFAVLRFEPLFGEKYSLARPTLSTRRATAGCLNRAALAASQDEIEDAPTI